MTTIPQVSQAMQTLLTSATEAADRQLHYTKRPDRAKFTASTLVQTLLFGWLAHPDATLEQLTHTAARVGVVVSTQALEQRLNGSTATLLQHVLTASMQHLIASDPVTIPILRRFRGVYVQDSTTIVLPNALKEQWAGCGGSASEHTAAALKCGVQLDLLSGCLSHLDLVDGRASDRRLPLQQARLPKGSLRLADLGFFTLSLLAELDAAGVYWRSTLEPTTLIGTTTEELRPLLAYVEGLGAVERYDEQVWVGKGGRLRARLLLQRVPQEVAEKRRRRIRKAARDKGVTPSAVALPSVLI